MKHLVALVGMKHRGEEAEELVRALPAGAPLHLVREPNNRHDPHAIQVYARHGNGELVHVGYLKSGQNSLIARWMDLEHVAPPAALKVSGDRWPMVEIET